MTSHRPSAGRLAAPGVLVASALFALAAAPGAVAAAPIFTRLVSVGAAEPVADRNACAPSPPPSPPSAPPSAAPMFRGSVVRPAVSGTGRIVVFRSNATGLAPLPPGSGAFERIYARDMVTGTTTLVSVPGDGGLPDGAAQGASVSRDGRYVAFSSCPANVVDPSAPLPATYVRDLITGTTELISVNSDEVPADAGFVTGNATAGETAISSDGRYVAFVSTATNLVSSGWRAPVPAGVQQVYVRDRIAGTTTLVSRSDGGMPGNAISDRPAITANGRSVAFESLAGNLVREDRNAGFDVFLRDVAAGMTELVSVDDTARQPAPGASPTTSNRPTVSAGGRYVAFRSSARLARGDLNNPTPEPGTPDVYVRDRQAGRTILVSVDSDGRQAPPVVGLDLQGPNIDASGHRVGYYTVGQLVPDDTNAAVDVYMTDWRQARTTLVSRTADGAVPAGAGRSFDPVMAANAPMLVYTSDRRLTAQDGNALQDTYLARFR
jgi:hypothetical protein